MRWQLLVLLLMAALAWAQPADIPAWQDLEFPPLPEVKIPEVTERTLPNGMKVYLLEDHELPLVGGFAMVRTGNLFDPPDKVGLAGITGEVQRTGGTRDKTGDEIDEQLENIAASVESGIGETSGSVSFDCLKENVDEVLAVFKGILTAPEFRDDKLQLALTQERSAISRRNDDASSIAAREFNEIVYGRDNPYGWRMEYEHLDRIQRDDLVAFHRRYFFPKNTLLAIQGDFDTAEMMARLEKLFADWTVEQPPVPEFPEVPGKPAPGIYVAAKEDVNQTFFRVGHLGGTLKDKDYPALEVMASILGGGWSSRLITKIRTELGYAYSVGAAWGANYNHPGLFRAAGSTKSESTTETIEVIFQEIEKMRSGEVTDDELKTAKDTVLNSFVFAFDSPGKTLSRLVRYDYHGYPKDFIFQYQKGIRAVTKADVLRVAKQYLRPDQMTVVAVGKPSDFGRPLTELGIPVHEIDLSIPEPKQEAATASDETLAAGTALLKRMRQAVGGAEKLAAVKDATWVAAVKVQGPQGQAMELRQTSRWLAPDKLRQDQQLPFGKMVVYFDGQEGWLAPPNGVQPMPPPVVQQVRGILFRNPFRLWLSDQEEGRTVNLAGDSVLEISGADGQLLRLEIDPETGLPRKQSYNSVQMTGAPSKIEDTFGDWREVDGIRLPFKTTTVRDGAPYAETVYEEIRINSGLTAEELGEKP